MTSTSRVLTAPTATAVPTAHESLRSKIPVKPMSASFLPAMITDFSGAFTPTGAWSRRTAEFTRNARRSRSRAMSQWTWMAGEQLGREHPAGIVGLHAEFHAQSIGYPAGTHGRGRQRSNNQKLEVSCVRKFSVVVTEFLHHSQGEGRSWKLQKRHPH